MLSVATGFLRHKVNRSPGICFDGKRNKGGIARQGGGFVKEGKREDPEADLGSGMLLDAAIWWWSSELQGPRRRL